MGTVHWGDKKQENYRTSCRDQRLLDLSEMRCSLGLPSIGKPLKGVFHVFSQSSLTEHKSEVSRRAEEGQFDFGGGLGEG